MATSKVGLASGLLLVAAVAVLPIQGADASPPSTPVTIPSTTVTIPTNNYTVSGTSQLLDAVASPPAGQVQYEISGGTLTNQVVATAIPTYYGWLAQWNTTKVPNGTYTLQSVASLSGGGSVTSAPITIVVNNAPPLTVVLIPASGAMLDTSNVLLLDAVASPGVTSVSISLTVFTVSMTFTATPTIYGWIAHSTAFTNASCAYQCVQLTVPLSVQSTASYASGLSATSPVVNTTALVWYGP